MIDQGSPECSEAERFASESNNSSPSVMKGGVGSSINYVRDTNVKFKKPRYLDDMRVDKVGRCINKNLS